MAVVNIDPGPENIIDRFDQCQDQVLAIAFDVYFCKPGGDADKIGGGGALLEDDLAGLVTDLEPAAVDQCEFKRAKVFKDGTFAVAIGAI